SGCPRSPSPRRLAVTRPRAHSPIPRASKRRRGSSPARVGPSSWPRAPAAIRRRVPSSSPSPQPGAWGGGEGGARAHPAAVSLLVALAEAGGMGVVEVDPTHVNFPSSHPLHIGYTQPSGVDPVLTDAARVPVVECDVPWYPALAKPAPDAAIIHLGVDPLFVRYPM